MDAIPDFRIREDSLPPAKRPKLGEDPLLPCTAGSSVPSLALLCTTRLFKQQVKEIGRKNTVHQVKALLGHPQVKGIRRLIDGLDDETSILYRGITELFTIEECETIWRDEQNWFSICPEAIMVDPFSGFNNLGPNSIVCCQPYRSAVESLQTTRNSCLRHQESQCRCLAASRIQSMTQVVTTFGPRQFGPGRLDTALQKCSACFASLASDALPHIAYFYIKYYYSQNGPTTRTDYAANTHALSQSILVQSMGLKSIARDDVDVVNDVALNAIIRRAIAPPLQNGPGPQPAMPPVPMAVPQ
jgi:hypothetical protein